MVFEEHKNGIVWKHEQNFSIIWLKTEQCYWHTRNTCITEPREPQGVGGIKCQGWKGVRVNNCKRI